MPGLLEASPGLVEEIIDRESGDPAVPRHDHRDPAEQGIALPVASGPSSDESRLLQRPMDVPGGPQAVGFDEEASHGVLERSRHGAYVPPDLPPEGPPAGPEALADEAPAKFPGERAPCDAGEFPEVKGRHGPEQFARYPFDRSSPAGSQVVPHFCPPSEGSPDPGGIMAWISKGVPGRTRRATSTPATYRTTVG